MRKLKASNGKIRIGTYYETEPKWAIFKMDVCNNEVYYGINTNNGSISGYAIVEGDVIINGKTYLNAPYQIVATFLHDLVVLRTCWSYNGKLISQLND